VARGQLEFQELADALGAIVCPGSVFELRCLGNRKRVDSGYFDNIADAATALSNQEEPYSGVYLTPNPVIRDVLARAPNRIKPWAHDTTQDTEIERRTWLLIDIDPVRPKGVSSTNLEIKRAVDKAKLIAGMLEFEYGWCQPMINSSGNGAHVMFPINEANDAETKEAIQSFLRSLAERYDEPGCKVDTSVFNASRIWKLPGTFVRKGYSTTERPHRKAKILQLACDFDTVTLAQIKEFNTSNPIPLGPKSSRKKAKPDDGQRKYQRLNKIALDEIDKWVPAYFPGARRYKEGYRVSSDELGRDREEDLTIHPAPMGIVDFGEHDMGDKSEGRRSPISVIAEFHHEGDVDAAANALAATLGVQVTEFDELPEEKEVKTYDKVFGESSFDFTNIKSYSNIRDRTFTELKWVIPNVLPAGCFILAARPKMRKTWLALQLCTAVASGGKFLDWPVNKGEALMLALEDNERRIKKRIETLYMFDSEPPPLDNFFYFTDGTFPRGKDGVEVIDEWLDSHPDCRLVVIDTFAHFREISKERDVYLKDYIAVMPLTRLASRREICILVVHHEKKGLSSTQSGDFLEDVSGSAGITGGVDGVISIKGRRGLQEENESRKLMVSGRDVPADYELDMSFDAERGGWLTAARQDVKSAIKSLLTKFPYMRQSEIYTYLPNVASSRVKKCLIEMRFENIIEMTQWGYSLKRGV
jgi:hypothetical protein